MKKTIVCVLLMAAMTAVVAFAGGQGEQKGMATITPQTAKVGPASDFKPISDSQIELRSWQFMTEIPKGNADLYNSQLGGHVHYAAITGDYPSIMQSMMIAGSHVDVMYAQPTTAARFYDAGWIIPAENFSNVAKIKADMYPNIVDAFSYKGKLMGLNYFDTGFGVPLVNMKLAAQNGLSLADVSPKSWHDLWTSIPNWQAKGIKYPYLPWWIGDWPGISWAFTYEVMDRGGNLADPNTHKPVVTLGGPVGQTLQDWKDAWNNDRVPKEVLQYTEADVVQAFGSGKYLLGSQHLYDIKRFNDPQESAFAGNAYVIPFQGQPWGMLDACEYLLVSGTTFKRSTQGSQDAATFINWYGYRDHNGKLFVSDQWIKKAMLFSAYKEVMEDPTNVKLVKSFMAKGSEDSQYDQVMKVYQNLPFPKGTFTVIWADDWNSWLREYLQRFLTENVPVDKAVQDMTDKINQLNTTYGL